MHAIQALKVNKITACLLLSHKHFIEAYLDTESYSSETEQESGTEPANQDFLPFVLLLKCMKKKTVKFYPHTSPRFDITKA